MPRKLENEIQRIEHDAQGMSSSNSYSQPWWRGFGNNDDSPASITEGTMNSSLKQLQFSVPTGIIQTQTNGGRGANKEEPSSIASKSGSDGNAGQEKQNFKHVPSSGASTIIEHLEPNSQMELVGHSIVLTSYPYTDPHYGGTMTPYGLQPMVHPYFYGMHQTRMPLPLEMEEEPVYVNAKQYHGILRRRQSRAKAELKKKVIKNRKPYLHESRHQHAMRRARGCGGRFLNKKKLDDDAANPTSEKGTNECATNSSEAANSAGSEDVSTYSISGHQGDSMVQNAHQGQTFTNVNSHSHGLSSIYHSSADGSEDGNFMDQQRRRMQANGAKQRALPIK